MSAHAVLTARSKDECIIDQGWSRYSSEDHDIWRILFERQQRTLEGHVCQEYLDGLDALGIGPEGVPDFAAMNARLRQRTGWEVVAVPGLIPSRPFFQMLANRQFPAGHLHPEPRAARLSRGARHLPRRLRPRAAARPTPLMPTT